MSTRRLPTYYLSHGGGPWPYMEGAMRGRFDKLERALLAIRQEWGTAVRAVLVVSGHWETPEFAVSSSAFPGMEYDYHGFPEHLYHIKYDAPGSPELAMQVRAMLEAGGIACGSDHERGFDHGTFSLMQPLYPAGDVPIVQLSVRQDLDPQTHLSVGRLLAPLRDQGVMIVGSGSSFHNLGLRGPVAVEPSRQFDEWLQQTLLQVSAAERRQRVVGWTQAPHARLAHPQEDHLIPLMVALGAAEEETATLVYHQPDFLDSWALSSFRFGKLSG
ncbi:aromatic ring-opening dioxygenase catalytic subunit (LigB family) [Bradyrhizobium macuxiense]|uniref:Aromatic ring-opening dioxygenase catalytic subunit (LigB family) n=1 Tax=Bradyrhizobium macuxiense TaxID=1755647 RepID=A0A560KX03_9BRAD|nr:class III extradiol ring-cleavage dioxygenase [Bradyrhizobium macuxiense]TWB87766.1 aromatic ring-opening dioxygenase catalytic subunit (LigB family) [Bradyrhizobium macuxiense]